MDDPAVVELNRLLGLSDPWVVRMEQWFHTPDLRVDIDAENQVWQMVELLEYRFLIESPLW